VKAHPSEFGHFLPEARESLGWFFQHGARFSACGVGFQKGTGHSGEFLMLFTQCDRHSYLLPESLRVEHEPAIL
jgi:hypothetical protein